MSWVRQMLEWWRARGQGRVRRVVVLVFEGLEPQLVDAYLEQGLLHHLALLSDIGTRACWRESVEFADGLSFRGSVDALGVRLVELRPSLERPPADLTSICDADRVLQERLFAVLSRTRRGVVLAVFDMPVMVRQLFGPHPDESEWHVIRDVYARMDEVVGKTLSFVDAKSALLVLIADRSDLGDRSPAATGQAYCNLKLEEGDAAGIALWPTVQELLRGTPPRSV